MRRAARVDDNQREIVSALRRMPGVSVFSLAAVGRGCPDLLVGVRGVNLLLEVKDGRKVASARCLTGDEAAFHSAWRGQACVVESVEDAVAAVRALLAKRN